MSSKNSSVNQFVCDMKNAVYLTGFVRRPQEGMFWLQQNNNTDQMIPIRVRSNMRVPEDKMPVTVLAHVLGETDANGGQQLVVRAYDIQRPSVRAMPALTTWVRGSGKTSDEENFRPFSSGPGIVPSLNENVSTNLAGEGEIVPPVPSEEGDDRGFTAGEQFIRDILQATRGKLDTRLGDNANAVQVAGFVDSAIFVPPNDFQSHGGYGLIMLRQHEDRSRNIPVRLHGGGATRVIMEQILVGIPIVVSGQIRMKTVPNDATGGKDQNLHIRTDNAYRAVFEKDFKRIPPWWSEMRDRVVEEIRMRKAAREELSKRKLDNGPAVDRAELARQSAMAQASDSVDVVEGM